MSRIRFWTLAGLIATTCCALSFLPGIYRKAGAASLAKFAANGLSVEMGDWTDENGNPISNSEEIRLATAREFEFVNESGERRSFVVCHEHPDYWVLMDAAEYREEGNRIRLVLSKVPLKDRHGRDHSEFAKYLRVQSTDW